ncbi:GATA zinc finger domain-containing protein 14-like [Cydia pomonella]|uniref:GATA zinc finger domain-containing protein 14-like n=1 Tax=Cydia pomonella TaxID=82600 RepID=UPI002ADE1A87|nr:GATA zinc finger domain-containing protein 14-like [Cydia pomonella]
MKKYLFVFLVISLSSCNGRRLGELLIGAHQQIHNKVHGVADAVIGGLSLLHGRHHQPAPHPPNQGGETIVVIVEENAQGDQGNPRPYGTPQQGHYPVPNGHNPYQGYNPNNGYNQGNQNNGHNHVNHNQGHPSYGPSHGYDSQPQPDYTANSERDPYQNGNKYGTDGQQQNIPGYPNQQGQYNNEHGHNQINQNNNELNNNVNPHPTGNPTNVINNQYPTANEVKTPEPTKPNSNDNYKPTETYNRTDSHQAENTNKNNEATKKPEDEGPLFVPLNGYMYGGDKIVINAPKRETDNGKNKNEESEEDFPIDIRFKDE